MIKKSFIPLLIALFGLTLIGFGQLKQKKVIEKIPGKPYYPIIPGLVHVYFSNSNKCIRAFDTVLTEVDEISYLRQAVNCIDVRSEIPTSVFSLYYRDEGGANLCTEDLEENSSILIPANIKIGNSWYQNRPKRKCTIIDTIRSLETPTSIFNGCLVIQVDQTKDKDSSDYYPPYFEYFQRGRGYVGSTEGEVCYAYLSFSYNMLDAKMNEEQMLSFYNTSYSFEQARQYEKEKKYEMAIWCYINLVSEDKVRVIESMKSMSFLLDTVYMPELIERSFMLYSENDPYLNSTVDGIPNRSSKIKRKWCDYLIANSFYSDTELSSAIEYAYRAMKKSKAKDYLGAIEDLTNAIRLDPQPKYFYSRGLSEKDWGDYASAIKDFDTLISMNYNIYQSYLERADCKENIYDFEGAVEDYTRAIFENDRDWLPFYLRACVNMRRKEFKKESIADFDVAIKLNPNSVGAYIYRGEMKKDLNDFKGACKDWKTAAKIVERTKKTSPIPFNRGNDIQRLIEENCGN